MRPAISVIVPVFNTEKYLSACVDSILAQTTKEIEVILVDDGSRDKSGDICDQYAEQYEHITVIHKPNGGIISARRAGVAAAKGQYVAFVDSDDWIEPDMYAEMLDCAREHGADVVLCDIRFETSDGAVLRENAVPGGRYCKQGFQQLYATMLFHYGVERPGLDPSLCNKIIRRDILERVIFDVDDSIVYGEDVLCSYPSLLDAKCIYVLRCPLYHYRQNFSSVTNTYDPQQMSKFLLLADELERQFKRRDADMERQLNGYIARCSLECIRSELLLHKAVPRKERRKTVRKYLSEPVVRKAFAVALQEITNSKTAFKMRLACDGHIFALHLLLRLNQMIRLGNGRNE